VLNKDVDSENEARLAELEGEEVICKASNVWRESMPSGTLVSVKKMMVDSLCKEMPEEVRLKVGAQVMLTRNKDMERNLVNGSRGVVERFVTAADGETLIPVVRFDSGLVTPIAKVEAVRYNPDGGREGCLVRTQIPLKLAWALTVHKSQGTTLTRALLDVSSAFEYGQCYVALSRVKSLDGLWLERPARLRNIMVSPQVLDFYSIK
jgi:ATP-dependent DNA helicase PIF1